MAAKTNKQPPTLEDYKAYTKELKGKIVRLQEKNKELAEEVVRLKGSGPSAQGKNLGRILVESNMKVVKAQAIWRGVLARRKFKNLLSMKIRSKPTANQVTAVPTVPKSTDKLPEAGVFNSLKKAAEGRGLTLEMLFRAADKEGTGTLSIEEFRIFLTGLKLPIPQSQLAR